MDADAALAVGLLPQRPAVLALHADGVLALLGEGGVVDHEDAVGAGELVGHGLAVAAPDGLLVPGTLAEELLEGLVGVGDLQVRRQGDAVGDRLGALAVAVGDQAAEVDAAPGGLAGAVEQVAEATGIGSEPLEGLGVEIRRECLVHTHWYEHDAASVRKN